MKKSAIIFFMMVTAIGSSVYCFAADDAELLDDKAMRDAWKATEPPPIKTSMVAAPDGGVFVLHGTKLAKYDRNLNLINQVDVKEPAPAPIPQETPQKMLTLGAVPEPLPMDKVLSTTVTANEPVAAAAPEAQEPSAPAGSPEAVPATP